MSIVVDYLACECCDPPNCSAAYLDTLPDPLYLTISGGTPCSDGTYAMAKIGSAPPGWPGTWGIPAWVASAVPIQSPGPTCGDYTADVFLLCVGGLMTVYVSGGGACSPDIYVVPYARTDTPFSVSQLYANCSFDNTSVDFTMEVTLVVTE